MDESGRTAQSVSNGTIVSAVVAIVLVVVTWVGCSQLQERHRLAMERKRVERLQEHFRAIKSGEATPQVFDTGLLALLASDAECAAEVERIGFFMVGVSAEDAKHVAQLHNLREIHFYDSNGADHVMRAARDLPLESLVFELAYLSDDSLRSLADFPELKRVRFDQVMYPEQVEILDSLGPEMTVEIPYPSTDEPQAAMPRL